MESFLARKNMTFDQCNRRQKEILTKEKPNIWDFYTWQL